jgi:hypothetical protein
MKDAWAELQHFEKVTPSTLVTITVMVWLSAMRLERERRHAPPPRRTDQAASAHELVPHARALANYVRAIDPSVRAIKGITETTLVELDRATTFIEREVEAIDKWVTIAKPPRKKRALNAPQVAFVNRMCDVFLQPKGRRPYSLVAILVNVAFDMDGWDNDRVKHCYRSRVSKKRRVGNIRRLLVQ